METCAAVKLTPTATGDIPVRCTKHPDHVTAGDVQHEGRVGVFPVRWISESAAAPAAPAE